MTALPLTPPHPVLGFLEGIGTMEMMLVAVIGLLLFGGKGLPDMARTFGKVLREFKKASANVEDEVKRVMNEEPAPPRPAPVRKPVRLDAAPAPTSVAPTPTTPVAPPPGDPPAA
jgi:TatA/E family protein of Tat protein translocase